MSSSSIPTSPAPPPSPGKRPESPTKRRLLRPPQPNALDDQYLTDDEKETKGRARVKKQTSKSSLSSQLSPGDQDVDAGPSSPRKSLEERPETLKESEEPSSSRDGLPRSPSKLAHGSLSPRHEDQSRPKMAPPPPPPRRQRSSTALSKGPMLTPGSSPSRPASPAVPLTLDPPKSTGTGTGTAIPVASSAAAPPALMNPPPLLPPKFSLNDRIAASPIDQYGHVRQREGPPASLASPASFKPKGIPAQEVSGQLVPSPSTKQQAPGPLVAMAPTVPEEKSQEVPFKRVATAPSPRRKAKLHVALKLNLEVELELKAHIEGDLTLALL